MGLTSAKPALCSICSRRGPAPECLRWLVSLIGAGAGVAKRPHFLTHSSTREARVPGGGPVGCDVRPTGRRREGAQLPTRADSRRSWRTGGGGLGVGERGLCKLAAARNLVGREPERRPAGGGGGGGAAILAGTFGTGRARALAAATKQQQRAPYLVTKSALDALFRRAWRWFAHDGLARAWGSDVD